MRCGLTSASRWYRSRRRRRRRCAGSVGGRPSRCADNYPATSQCPRTVRRRARSVQCPDRADCPTTHPCIRHTQTTQQRSSINQSVNFYSGLSGRGVGTAEATAALAPAMLKPRGRGVSFRNQNIFPHFCMLFLKLPLFVVMLPTNN